MQDSESLYDQTIRKLKNNKVVVIFLIGFVVVLGLAQIQGAFSGLLRTVRNPKIHLQASIRPYDFMGGTISPEKNLASLSGQITQISILVPPLTKQILTEIGAGQTTLDACLQIEGGALRASQPLQAAVLVFGSPTSQMARIGKNLGDANGIDISALFKDSQFVNGVDNAVDMEVVPQHGYFQREPLSIFRRHQGLSFEPDHDALAKVIHFTAQIPKIMLAVEAGDTHVEDAKESLDFALRSELAKHSSLELSPLTQSDLDEQRKAIQRLGEGIAKSQLEDKYNVDYIVKVKILSD
jgi:hypothetical protein